MNGIDLLIFTGGIGENDFNMRAMICSEMEYLGIDFDARINHGIKSKDLILSKPESRVVVMTVTTDEELVIATDTRNIVESAAN
jgi:acetate kinase